MWKRGKCSRSNSLTEWPCWAIRVEAVDPAGPPPMTTTSAVSTVGCDCVTMRGVLRKRGSGPGTAGLLVRLAGGLEQVGQAGEFGRGQVAELTGVALAHRGV